MVVITPSNCKQDLPDFISLIPNKRKKSGKYFVVTKHVKIKLSDNSWIIIEPGFEFDGSSRPKFVGWLLDKYGAFTIAALIHDWMYVYDYRADEIGNKMARQFADDEMLFWSRILNSDTWWQRVDNYIRYYGVALFGKFVY